MSTPTDLSLEEISRRTVGHYETHADSYWAGTHDHDVSQNINALLAAVEGEPPFDILDLGCGPGRDLKTFRDLGHRAVGLDGAGKFVVMARAHSGCEVWQQDLLSLALPTERFDGVFANAVLFHLPSTELPTVLRRIREGLRLRGVLFCSNPRGPNREGWFGERYGHYCELERWREFMHAAGFEEVTHYYRPAGQPRAEQHWLASVWRVS